MRERAKPVRRGISRIRAPGKTQMCENRESRQKKN